MGLAAAATHHRSGARPCALTVQLERKLGDKARLSGQPRSQVIRGPLEDLLSHREREQAEAALNKAMRGVMSLA